MNASKFGLYYGLIFGVLGIISAGIVFHLIIGELPVNKNDSTEGIFAIFTIIQFIAFGGYFGKRAAKHSEKNPHLSITNGIFWAGQTLLFSALLFDLMLFGYWFFEGILFSQFAFIILLFIPFYTIFIGIVPAVIIGSIFGYIMKRKFNP